MSLNLIISPEEDILSKYNSEKKSTTDIISILENINNENNLAKNDKKNTSNFKITNDMSRAILKRSLAMANKTTN